MWSEIGYVSLGFILGLAAGLSETPGTTRSAIVVIAVLVGGVSTWITTGEQAGLHITCLAISFGFGLIFGALLRIVGLWIKISVNVMPQWRKRR